MVVAVVAVCGQTTTTTTNYIVIIIIIIISTTGANAVKRSWGKIERPAAQPSHSNLSC
jgi:hypothetical protein